MTNVDWSDFSKLVEAAMCAERYLAEEKSRNVKEGQCNQGTNNT